MGYIPFERGKPFELFPRSGEIWLGRGLVYVRKEVLPKGRGEWETFYSIWGGTEIRGAESGIMDGILQRVRIRPEGIITVLDNKIHYDGEIFTSLIIEDQHTPIVDSWIREALEIDRDLAALVA